MKKSVLLLSVLILIFCSCKKDDPAPKTESILGTWYSTVSVVTNCTDEESNGDLTFSCPNGDCISYTFVEDSVAGEEVGEMTLEQLYSYQRTTNGSTSNESGTFSLSAGKIELCIDEEGEVSCRTLDLVLSGDELSLTGTDQETDCKEVVSFDREASE